MRAVNEMLIFKCIDCNKEYEKELNNELIGRFANTYKFCDNDLDKFIMLLRKGVYPYDILMNGINLMKKYCQVKNHFIII